MNPIRLDQYLVRSGLVSSRERAGEMIRRGAVKANGVVVDRPGKKFDTEPAVELLEAPMPWVSRGALKLLAALDAFKVDVTGRVCLDVGSSTGGFTEVLLDRGARKVFALDAGTDQLAERLRTDERVVSLEQQNIRTASDDLLGEPVALVVVDVSFISLKLILPELKRFTAPGADVIALVKPQFEVGPAGLNKHGVVKNEKLQQFALREVVANAENVGYRVAEPIESPVKGGDGNLEYLIHLK
jgi:23S rRNA (cytidine1920-2'-O)/16S rRNA (cytidine1409-2'-O)-methyltransferase